MFPTKAPSAIDIGELDKTYAVVRDIGRGGMGAVVLARHREAGYKVAIKIASAEKFDAEALARFQREARLMASFQHPNIVRLYDVVPIGGGRVGIVMEYVRGVSLARLLDEKKKPLAFERVTGILRDLGHALAHAHSQGVVHRDVKPHNVLVEQDSGRAKLSDFGIAKVTGDDSEVTAVGAVLGTPAYMSPEQIDGHPIDGRSDIYGLGILGWEMITGARPWAGEQLYQLLHKQKHEALPAVTSYRPETPAALLLALEGALEKDPALRWSSVGDMVAQLESQEPTPAMVERRRRVAAAQAARGASMVDSSTMPIYRRPRPSPPAAGQAASGATLPNAGTVAAPPPPPTGAAAAPAPQPGAKGGAAGYVRPRWMLPSLFGLGTLVGGLLMLLAVREFGPSATAANPARASAAPASTGKAVPTASRPVEAPPPPPVASATGSKRGDTSTVALVPVAPAASADRAPTVASTTRESPATLERRATVLALASRARSLLYAGQLAPASAVIDSALALDPRSSGAYLVRARLRIGRGDVRDAWTDIELAARTGAKWEALALTTMLKARELGPAEARERLTPELRAALTPRRVLDAEHAVALAVALAQVRDTATALTLLELAGSDSRLPGLLADPLLSPLAGSARFQRLRRQVGR